MLTAAYSTKGLPLYTKTSKTTPPTCTPPAAELVTASAATTFYFKPWHSICLAVPILLVGSIVVIRTLSLLVDSRRSCLLPAFGGGLTYHSASQDKAALTACSKEHYTRWIHASSSDSQSIAWTDREYRKHACSIKVIGSSKV